MSKIDHFADKNRTPVEGNTFEHALENLGTIKISPSNNLLQVLDNCGTNIKNPIFFSIYWQLVRKKVDIKVSEIRTILGGILSHEQEVLISAIFTQAAGEA